MSAIFYHNTIFNILYWKNFIGIAVYMYDFRIYCRLFPTSLLQDVEKLIKYAFGNRLKKKLQLYEKFLHMRNKEYLDWAIEQMICWEQTTINSKVIHIHGDADEVFPIQYIKNCIVVKDGTHAMILTKYRWFNTHLPAILLE